MVRGWKTVLKKFEGTPRSGTGDTHGFLSSMEQNSTGW